MKRLLYILPFLMLSCKTMAQPPQKEGGIGSVKTEEYQAEFEKKQSINAVADYTDATFAEQPPFTSPQPAQAGQWTGRARRHFSLSLTVYFPLSPTTTVSNLSLPFLLEQEPWTASIRLLVPL